jgi:hypothetical protein
MKARRGVLYRPKNSFVYKQVSDIQRRPDKKYLVLVHDVSKFLLQIQVAKNGHKRGVKGIGKGPEQLDNRQRPDLSSSIMGRLV